MVAPPGSPAREGRWKVEQGQSLFPYSREMKANEGEEHVEDQTETCWLFGSLLGRETKQAPPLPFLLCMRDPTCIALHCSVSKRAVAVPWHYKRRWPFVSIEERARPMLELRMCHMLCCVTWATEHRWDRPAPRSQLGQSAGIPHGLPFLLWPLESYLLCTLRLCTFPLSLRAPEKFSQAFSGLGSCNSQRQISEISL